MGDTQVEPMPLAGVAVFVRVGIGVDVVVSVGVDVQVGMEVMKVTVEPSTVAIFVVVDWEEVGPQAASPIMNMTAIRSIRFIMAPETITGY